MGHVHATEIAHLSIGVGAPSTTQAWDIAYTHPKKSFQSHLGSGTHLHASSRHASNRTTKWTHSSKVIFSVPSAQRRAMSAMPAMPAMGMCHAKKVIEIAFITPIPALNPGQDIESHIDRH